MWLYLLLALPPHTAHICQPLDVAVYKSLKSHLSKLINLGKMLRGDFWVAKKDVASIIKKPFEESLTIGNIKSGFKKCGIYPFNPNSIDKTQLIRNQIIPDINGNQADFDNSKFKDVECQTDPMDIELLPTSAIKLHSSNSQKSKLTCSKSF